MEPCDKCGQESEDLIAQPNGQLFCLNCHLGLGPEITDEEYNRLRIMYDKDADFKRLRHRFWALGLKRRYTVLVNMGCVAIGETVIEKIERFRLYKIKENDMEGALVEQIEIQEAEILAENEKSEFIKPSDIPTGPVSGRVHAGKASLRVGPTNPDTNPWEESQK